MTQVNKLDPALGQVHLHKTFQLLKLKLILNGKCGVINSGPVLPPPRHLLESYSNNGPSEDHSNPVSDEACICSSPSWWLPHLAKGTTRDFNNGPGNDSNNGCMSALQCLFESNLNNGPSPSHFNQSCVRWSEYTSVQVSYLWFPGGCHICPRAAGLTSIMAQEVNRIVTPF